MKEVKEGDLLLLLGDLCIDDAASQLLLCPPPPASVHPKPDGGGGHGYAGEARVVALGQDVGALPVEAGLTYGDFRAGEPVACMSLPNTPSRSPFTSDCPVKIKHSRPLRENSLTRAAPLTPPPPPPQPPAGCGSAHIGPTHGGAGGGDVAARVGACGGGAGPHEKSAGRRRLPPPRLPPLRMTPPTTTRSFYGGPLPIGTARPPSAVPTGLAPHLLPSRRPAAGLGRVGRRPVVARWFGLESLCATHILFKRFPKVMKYLHRKFCRLKTFLPLK
jgi:hypothetical protein